MELTTLISTFLLFLLLIFIIQSLPHKLPPGPKGFPILGSLHLLGKSPHTDLLKLSKQYGPIMFMKLGLVPTVVVSTPQAAEQFLKTHDLIFASRPPFEAFKLALYNKDLVMAPYGPYWRTVRKMCTLELLSTQKINSFKPMRKEEVSLFIESVKRSAFDGSVVNLSSKVSSLSADMICRMVLGRKYEDSEFDERGFKDVIQEGMGYAATPNLADYIPLLGVLDLQGLRRNLKRIGQVYDAFLVKVIHEHDVSSGDEKKNKDFVDLLLSFMRSGDGECRIDIDHVKAILLDMIIAGMDTSSSSIEWTLSEILKHPRVMRKVQQEIQNIVGPNRLVEESDLDRLSYLNMVVKESMRLHPVAPLLLPHESTQDCVVDGYHIPKKSRIFINVHAMGRDPNNWEDPQVFYPERFLDSDIDVRGRNFELIPFGSGRRSCPGMQLGYITVRLVVAQLIHCFDWKLPEGYELDMVEHTGLVTSRAHHLLAIPTYRLHE